MQRSHHTLTALPALPLLLLATTCQLLPMTTATATTAAKGKSPPERRHLMQQQQQQQTKTTNTNTMPYLRTTNDILNLVKKRKDSNSATAEEEEEEEWNNNNNNWMSITEDVEFLPLLNMNDKTRTTRKLGSSSTTTTTGAHSYNDPFSIEPFVEGMSNYDEYQQAWRLIGFMIDCNTHVNTDDDDERSHDNGEEITDEGCARYVIWGAYVDLEYEGGGIGEYQYWDRSTGQWDDTACNYADGGNGSSRCAKMDCHLETTHFSVLGFFKHKSYDDWMEQLFKHEGMCVWDDDEYSFMKDARKAWPRGCTYTGQATADGDLLYYNIRPIKNGRIEMGLYTDTKCVVEYPADTDYIENIVGNIFQNHHSGDGGGDNDYSGDSLYDSMKRWHSAFDAWHICHPCVAHDLENTGGDKYTQDSCYDDDYSANYDDAYWSTYDDQYGYYGRKLGGEHCPDGDVFECYDDAGYTNVNQCMKFSAKTVMHTATFRDLSTGSNQGSLVEYPLAGFIDQGAKYQRHTVGNLVTYCFLASAVSLFCYSLWTLIKARKATGGMTSLRSSLLTLD